LLIDGYVSINSIGAIQVESVILDIGGVEYKPNQWESIEAVGLEEPSAEFELPISIQRGKRTAYLKAIVDGRPYEAKPITIDLPQGKRVFHREGS
jgi:hypothetical protein